MVINFADLDIGLSLSFLCNSGAIGAVFKEQHQTKRLTYTERHELRLNYTKKDSDNLISKFISTFMVIFHTKSI